MIGSTLKQLLANRKMSVGDLARQVGVELQASLAETVTGRSVVRTDVQVLGRPGGLPVLHELVGEALARGAHRDVVDVLRLLRARPRRLLVAVAHGLVAVDRQALADFLCVDRSALSAELSKLRSERKVESVKNHFKLLG